MPKMRAMQLDRVGAALRPVERAIPEPGHGEVLIEVAACGVCRTDLHVIDGDVPANLPVIPGHEVVGRVVAMGEGVSGREIGERIGVPWLASTCGDCFYCEAGQENLCDHPQFTGATRDGGYATHIVADARFCFPIPDAFDDVHAAPLLCAGLIGHRSLRMAGNGSRLGLYGFGAAAHIVAQAAIWEGCDVFALTRPGDEQGQDFARALGCRWAGGSDEVPPQELDAAILFAPVGALVPAALKAVRKGGTVVCAGIHMSDIPSFPYANLWGERVVRSVANLTRDDGRHFFTLAGQIPVATTVTTFPLSAANEAVQAVRDGALSGAAVLIPD
ncbi:zinc-dependent alcohol dehydrogenase family protein [Stakelama marina]|uniref:alcohol dehydrogenase n=1 Tax=Stakelama marina TaxID=2826939 RepID=A0A8T4I9W0_9SPHN|nr:zinc-dependent alcohol dehydrogenase family protein [Stakelama marina]MBR0551300.1 zinc-dependent alcohol dehydrogenase family protein [Stakelama marina]